MEKARGVAGKFLAVLGERRNAAEALTIGAEVDIGATAFGGPAFAFQSGYTFALGTGTGGSGIPRVTVSSTSPQAMARNASNMMPIDNTAVGRRCTSPSCKYVTMTGIASPIETMARETPIPVNSGSGRSAR
mgnify:CR=1 FL=1